MTQIPASADLYFRPTAFVDAPVGLDGQVKKLAGGMQWFSAFEAIAVSEGRRVAAPLVPVAELDDFLDALSDAQVEAARGTIARIEGARAPLALGERTIRLDEPKVAGILNITPDSFSDGGNFDEAPEAAAEAGFAMSAAGAAMIDVGGESTRPGADDVWEEDEIARVISVIERLAAGGTAISIDTRKAAVMEAAFAAGAQCVNDVSGLRFDERAVEVVAKAGCPVIVMHHPGKPHELHAEPNYSDVLIEIYDWLSDRVDALAVAGIAREKIIIDPGIGFGKSLQNNLALLNGLSLFHGIGCPVMLGASRKRMIGALSNEAAADQRLGGSLALALKAADQGVQLIRVHDVPETVQALHVWRGLRDGALTPTG